MADRYVVAAGGNWNSSSTWSATSGGAGGASVPTLTDNVFCDANSGSLVVNTATGCANFDCTGYTATLSGATGLTITGDTFKLSAASTYTFANQITFTGANAAGDVTITRAGKNTSQPYVFDGVGKVFKLADAHDLGASAMTLTNGTLNSQGFNITCSQLALSNANVRTATLTGSVLTQTSSFTCTNTTNLTWSPPAEISVPLVTTPTSNLISFSSSIPLLTVRLNTTGAGYGGIIALNATGALSGLVINEMRFTGTPTTSSVAILLQLAGNIRIDKCSFPDGVQLISTARGTQRTVTTNTNELSFDGCMIRDIAISGGTAVALDSIDLGNNTNIQFGPFGANTHTITGITKDNDGNVLPSCTVIAYKEYGGESLEVSRTTSNAVTGAYTLGTPDADANAYTIVATKTTPYRADAMNGLTPT